MRIKWPVFLCIALMLITFTGCSSLDKMQQSTLLGSAAGGAIGATIGKRAGNTVVGATIGAALGATTGAFIGRKIDDFNGIKSGDKGVPLYVINGIPYSVKSARHKLTSVNPSQIESIVVLKMDQARALYGNKGENGAILISLTKKI